MTGGMAFVYDPEELLPQRINPDSVIFQRVETDYWERLLRDLIDQHRRETYSRFAEQILVDWPHERNCFWQVVPKEMLSRLEQPISAEALAEQRA